ncbi:hypothetical protein EPUS_06282 [Endocarpon pusillum Z07020]|uniref:SSCRP protein n=1 Tax=Endocarpon pusillum (strain Z07020 / HMAS-L-300199) TaxID=1263415 RepID=U1I4L6_ENDPU|nr:uncharacterized protein EPUS_06282 [Endocarpon pusillum Z07020]ERF77064.1 hypothetical protein EPUS_06282 [Endocarpon pusillum Z07020]
MKFFLALTSAILGAALAAPGQEMQKRQITEVTLFLYGAGDAGYSITVPTNGASIPIDNPLSVSRVSTVCGATCFLTGAQGSSVMVRCNQGADIGPPQPQVSAICFRN